MTAPISPPNSACDELEGSPTSHVSRFQMIAPSSPAKTMGAVINESSNRPPEIVLATAVDRQAPTRLSTAARMTATRGRSAPVAIGPAIALALSWKPLVKSKIRATTMTVMTTNSSVTSVPHPERVVWCREHLQ